MNEFNLKVKKLTESSWTFIFESDTGIFKLWASNFMNPIEELFFNLRMFLKNGQTNGKVSMIDEPEENIWVLERSGDLISLEIYNFKDYCENTRNLKDGKKIFSGKTKFQRFLNQIINSLHEYNNEKRISNLVNELTELRKENKL